MRARDNQRKKVYQAENVLSLYSKRFETTKDMQSFVGNVTRSPAFKEKFKLAKQVIVTDGRGRRRACCASYLYSFRLKMPKWARTDWILLHELSHAVTEDKYAWHGPEFCANYLYLVSKFMGDVAYGYLVDSFKLHGVRFSI